MQCYFAINHSSKNRRGFGGLGCWGDGLAVAPTQAVTSHRVSSDGMRSIVSSPPGGSWLLLMDSKHAGSGSVSRWESLGGKPPRIDASCSVWKLLLWNVMWVAALSKGGPSGMGGPSPSGHSRYYQASSPGYSLGIVQVLVDGEGILRLALVKVVAVVRLIQELIGLFSI